MKIAGEHERRAERLLTRTSPQNVALGYLAAVERLTEEDGFTETRGRGRKPGHLRAVADAEARGIAVVADVLLDRDEAREFAYELLALADIAEAGA